MAQPLRCFLSKRVRDELIESPPALRVAFERWDERRLAQVVEADPEWVFVKSWPCRAEWAEAIADAVRRAMPVAAEPEPRVLTCDDAEAAAGSAAAALDALFALLPDVR